MNYKMKAVQVLLCEDCVLQRYHPLLPYKSILLQHPDMTKEEFLSLSDDALADIGFRSHEIVLLLKSFLCMYDIKAAKLKEIDSVASDKDEKMSFRELYLLPEVKATGARLYYEANYRFLEQIANSTPDQIIDACKKVANQNPSYLKVPLPKEVRTHIAVAKAFTVYKP